MPQAIILGTAVSIQAKRPTTRYGVINPMPIDQAMAVMLLRTSLTRIPRRATITRARLRIAQHRATDGGRTMRVRRITSTWGTKTTWRTRPSTSSIIDQVNQGASPMSTRWVFDVTSEVQQYVNGTLENRGWEISMEQTYALTFRGTPADSRPPDIVIDYAVTPDQPTNLHPASGEISVPNPTLTFDADDEITALRVQIDPEANEDAPAWGSGTIAATGGLLDLADPDGLLSVPYPGLAENATTYWRVRQRNAAGWSEWSEWAQMTRTPVGALTITQPPSGEISDPTPTIGWTFTGTQTAWRARLLDDDGDQLSSSGTTVGTDDLWRPRTGFTREGQTGYIVVDVWDDTDRVATPDQPEYVTTTLPVTFTPDGTVDPVDQLEAVQLDASPDVTIRGSRAVIPDTLNLYRAIRDSAFTLIGTYDALDVFEGSEGNVLVNTNRLINPAVSGDVEGWAAGSNTGIEYVEQPTWVGLGSLQATMTGDSGYINVSIPASHRFDVSGGETLAIMNHVQPATTARPVRIGVRTWDESGAALSDDYLSWVDQTGDEFTELAGLVDVPETAVTGMLLTQVQNPVSGEVHYMDGGMVASPEEADDGTLVMPAYFDGNSPAADGFNYSWRGEENNSVSEKRTDGTAPYFSLVDHTAPMNSRKIRYYVTAGVEGKQSKRSPVVQLDTRGLGVWITDLETGGRAVVWGVEAEQESTENAIVHEPLNRTNQNYNQKIIRRRLVTYQPSGTIDGILADVSQPGMPTAEECERQFRIWRNNDAGHLYQIHLGRDTRPVIIGDISLAEREENRARDRLLNVSFGWWSQNGPDEG